MPHFAYCPGGLVQKVERIEGAAMLDDQGNESETVGREFLAALYPGTSAEDYVMTYYPVGQPDPYPRGKYATQGDMWDGLTFTEPLRPEPTT